MVQAAGAAGCAAPHEQAEATQDGEGAGEAGKAGRSSVTTGGMKANAAGEGTVCGQLCQQSSWLCLPALHGVVSAAALHRRCRCHGRWPMGEDERQIWRRLDSSERAAMSRQCNGMGSAGGCMYWGRQAWRQARQTHTETGEQRGSHWTGCASPAVGISAIKDRSSGLPAAPHTQAAAGGCRRKQGV
ncbi:hypothetical protein BC831DRAFT_459968 [Entophlyctis helioformis]|nr:hypothetical protein BC831DRAFT_459968 [Entophlyctis helioformis]